MRKLMVRAVLVVAVLVASSTVQIVSAAGAQEVMEKIRLAHVEPNAMVRLLASDSPELPKANDTPAHGQLVIPRGISGLLGYPLDRSLLVKGTPDAIVLLKAALTVADVPREQLPGGLVKLALQPVHAKAPALREAILLLPGAGKATLDERRVVLEGKPEWIHRALRTAIRLEIEVLKPPAQEKK